ncbi:MAG TPA: molybdopterin-dependent oxidoreductase [Thermoanaerobaculia bacterium]
MAGATAGAAIGLPGGRLFSNALLSANQPIYPPRGPEEFILSVCNACPGGCGIRARRIGNRVVKIEGNPLHPISGGRLCLKGQAALQALYHPDRIRTPLRRVGPRGALASFRPTTWETALREIAARLRSVREEQRPESVVLIRGAGGEIGTRVARRFIDAFGSPNDIPFDRASEASAAALFLTQGLRATPASDIRAADYILSLGSEMLEASPSPVYTTRAYGDFRQSHAARRGKLVHVDPRLSITAASADEWIHIQPGTHATFALGIAGAMIAEGLHDREFVGDNSTGFDDGPDGGLSGILEQHFPLEKVAAETGVSVNVILRVAREFAGAQKGLALAPNKGPLLGGRAFDHLAVHILNAVAGNIDQPGGLLVAEDVQLEVSPSERDAIAAAGHRRPRLDGVGGDSLIAGDPEQLAQAFATGQPYRAEVLFIVAADPLYASTVHDRFAAAVEHVPLVVSFATIPNDTALYADWVLPEPHFLEQWSLHTSPASVAFPMVSLGSPALPKPLHDVRSTGDVFLDLARRIGLQHALPWPDVPALMHAEVDRLFEARRGAIMGTSFDAAWVRMMEGAGWWAPGYSTAEELWKRSLESGGWWDPFYDHGDWGRVLRTASKRFDFRPDIVRQFAESTSAPAEGAGSLSLILFEPLPIAGGTGAELPSLQALLDPGHEERWQTWGEIHPETASSLRIRDGALIRVASARQAILVRARVTDRIVPGAIAIPVGLGKMAGGRWSEGIGSNPLRLLDGAREPFSLLPDFGGAKVLVSEATPSDQSTVKRT